MIKAADLDDAAVLAVLPAEHAPGIGMPTTTVAEHFPGVPPKVVRAKLDKLARRGLASGCACGCRGDWSRREAR